MTKRRNRALFLLLWLFLTAAYATPSCSDWLKQSDGSYWRECVGDDGATYCEVSYDGGQTAQRVKCN